jgi:molybdenum cofactor synthesis domain-containing protein
VKKIRTVDAVGHVICHDITRIVKDVVKDVAFKKGHIVRKEDIEMLLSMGKDNLYVWEKQEGMLHENEAADILYEICKNEHMKGSEVKEGKIELSTECDGLFKVDVKRLEEINSIDEIIIASRHTNYPVRTGDKLAATRVIPLVISEEKLVEAKKIWDGKPIFEVLPYKIKKVGVVTTGNEVFYGRIQDKFTPVIIDKLSHYGIKVMGHEVVNDDKEKIIDAIRKLKSDGAEMILCTGGMSVDPDDITPSAIKECGAKLISYGAPVLPGAMFLLAYFDDGTPVLGLPGCVMYARSTVFDLILPRVAAGIEVTARDISALGHGGLCLQCDICRYPDCGFGKGV